MVFGSFREKDQGRTYKIRSDARRWNEPEGKKEEGKKGKEADFFGTIVGVRRWCSEVYGQ